MNDTRVGILLFTGIEVVVLVVWLTLVRSGALVAGVAVLLVGLIVEHIVAHNVAKWKSLANLAGVPIGPIAVFSVIETGVWAAWLAVTSIQPALAILVLVGGLVVEHSITDNVAKGRPLFSPLVDPRTIPFSVIEAVGAVVWLSGVMQGMAVQGVIVLAIASFIEHMLGVRLARALT